MQRLSIGLIGGGFMGRAHTLAFRAAAAVFSLPRAPHFEIVADATDELAQATAANLGFDRATGDWRQLVGDPAVDLVDIATPNVLHKPMSLAAIAAGKHVYCEKPLAPTADDAKAMVEAADAAGVKTFVGFNYLKNPIAALARDIVRSGEIGEVVNFRGIHAEDYMADPTTPFSWRLDPASGPGALGDLGSHLISMARFLVGDIVSVCGQLETVVKERPVRAGQPETQSIDQDDQARALVRFANGAGGVIEASWVAAGRQMQLAYEITGTRGAIAFTQERMNELKLYTAGQPAGRDGFKTITAGPDHPPYGEFCPAPGHQLGFNDMKTIEVRDLVEALADERQAWPDFREAWQVQRVIDAVMAAATEQRWIEITDG